MADNSFESFLGILRDHGIPFDRDALESAFDNPESQTAIQAWMDEYLSPETLLTRDEAALYSALLKSGKVDTLSTSQDLTIFPGLNEKDIQDAIEELKRSSVAIEKQTESLKLQQNAMSLLVKDNARLCQRQSEVGNMQQGTWEMEKGNTVTAVEELTLNLKDRIAELEQQGKTSETATKQSIEEVLRSDDRLLSSLQKLANDLDPVQSEDTDTIARIKELCARLIKYTVEGIRTKLDRIYLEALNSPVQRTDGHDTTDQEVSDLQDELESLYAEILPVAQMSAEQHYLEPALRDISATKGQGQDRSVKAIKYMRDCLQYLVERTEILVRHTQEHQCHKMALQYMLEEAKKELQRSEIKSPNIKLTSARPSAQRAKSSGATSPVRRRATRRRSSGPIDDEIEPEQQLLRNLGISLPDAASDRSRIDALERAFLDRANKLDGHAHSLQSTIETSISSHLLDAHVTLHILRNSLLAQSPYNSISLLDPEVESSLSTLENDIQQLQEKLEQVDLQKLQARNVHREQFVERWLR